MNKVKFRVQCHKLAVNYCPPFLPCSTTQKEYLVQQVLANKGSAGVDGMHVSELKEHLSKGGLSITESIKNGSYLPKPS